MLTYLSFYCCITLAALFFNSGSALVKKACIAFTFSILLLFSGLRGRVGSDTPQYIGYFQLSDSRAGAEFLLSILEPLFVALLVGLRYISDSNLFFIFVCSGLQSLLLLYIYKKSKNKNFIFVYALIFYLNFHFNTLRAGFATLFFLAALAADRKTYRYLFLLAAPGFHFSILVFYPLIFFSGKALRVIPIIIVVLSVIIFFIGFSGFAFDKLYSYDGYLVESGRASILFALANGVFYLVSAYFVRGISQYSFRSAIFLAICYGALMFFPIFYRFIILGHVIYFYGLLEGGGKLNFQNKSSWLFLPLFVLLFLQGAYGVYNESEALERRSRAGEDVVQALESTYIPYKFYWDDALIKEN